MHHELKHLLANMISRLVFNSSLSLGYFPKFLKHVIMIFIPKSSLSPHHVENYKSISLFEIHGKILDKNHNTRLNHHLTSTRNPQRQLTWI